MPPSARAMAAAAKASVEQVGNIKFVQETEKYPCIYNYTLNEYFNKDVTEKAWQPMTHEIEDTYFFRHSEKFLKLHRIYIQLLNSNKTPSLSIFFIKYG